MNPPVSRRSFLKRSAAALLTLGPAAGRLVAADTDKPFDLLVAGGTVIDPYHKTKGVASVAIQAGQIVRVGEQLDPGQAARVLDAKGLYVSPGWIDLHAHVFTGGVDADRDVGVYAGVTTLADPGGVRASDFDEFRRQVVDKSQTRVLSFLNVSAHRGAPVHGDWALFDQKLTIQTLVAHPDVLKGVKVLSSQRHSGNLGLVPTKLAVQAARESGTRVMAHIGVAPPLIQDVLDLLGRGDIVTHCFKGFPGGLFHRDGRAVAEAWKALERGVRFDLGHGAGSFAWAAARHARACGFPLHSISTDLHRGNVNGPVWTYGRTLAKGLHLGYALDEVVKLATLGPAELIGAGKELGSLLPGTVADLTVFRVVEAPTVLTDSEGNSETGKWDVEPVHCIRAGQVFSQMKIPSRTAATKIGQKGFIP
jgi:dihydroorotase